MSNISFQDIESVPSNLESDVTDDMINVYKYRRSVKIFSIIDFIFNIVYFASYASYYFMFTCLKATIQINETRRAIKRRSGSKNYRKTLSWRIRQTAQCYSVKKAKRGQLGLN